MYFNSHAHEGRDQALSDYAETKTDISTHTPTRGVTMSSGEAQREKKISTHTPTRGVTL